jgi:alkylation response protein AidB-like acyl-CoA dehydrogenase
MVDMAVAYACEREQFGRPIGSFQAVKHRLADAQVALEFARPVVYRAAFSVADGASDRELHVSHAKAAASEAASLAAKAALQVHGAIGYTWEMDLHFWMKRAWALDAVWGGGAWHRRRLARSLLGAAAA